MPDRIDPCELEWIAPAPERIVRLHRDGPDHVRFEDTRLDAGLVDAALAAAGPEPLGPIAVLHDEWRVAVLRPFRPLIYYCAFADPDVFACLDVSLRSLLERGRYRHEIAIVTSARDAPRVEALRTRLRLGHRLHVVLVADHADFVDFTLARFRLDDPVFERRQPLLYLDCDIAVDAPVEPFLAALAGSDRVHVRREGQLDEGHPDSSGHWYGWRLMAADGMAFHPRQPGFNSGFLAAGRSDILRATARLILKVAAGYQRVSGERRPFLGYDQSVANYVMLKTGIRSFDLVAPVLALFRIDPEAPLALPPRAGHGFVHFLNATAAGKHAAMTAYLDGLALPDPTAGPG